jgi:hypothetical protein
LPLLLLLLIDDEEAELGSRGTHSLWSRKDDAEPAPITAARLHFKPVQHRLVVRLQVCPSDRHDELDDDRDDAEVAHEHAESAWGCGSGGV